MQGIGAHVLHDVTESSNLAASALKTNSAGEARLTAQLSFPAGAPGAEQPSAGTTAVQHEVIIR